jgi:hypothetical protein
MAANVSKLQLGDIIQMNAPNDSDIHEHIYHIVYIDENKIRLEEAGNEQILTFTDGYWDNEAIESIIIRSRAEEIGYARQNNLLNGVWVDIYFSGDLPITLTGKITNLEEDKIEVTTFPENDVIFIDFSYKGLPEDLPIEKIQIRKAPDASLRGDEDVFLDEPLVGEQGEQGEQGQVETIGKNKNKEKLLLDIPEEETTDEALEFEKQQEIQEQTRTFIFNADQIHFGEDLEAITQIIDVPEEEQRFDIDKQLDDLLDDMLSAIPNAKRTTAVKNDIHKMIERFKQLRDQFSVFNDKGYALMPLTHDTNYKPLVKKIEQLETQLYWLLPVVKNTKKIYYGDKGDDEADAEMDSEDIELINLIENLTAELEIIENYEQNAVLSAGNKYAILQKKLNPFLTPFLEPIEKEDILAEIQVNTNITTLVNNLGNFNSTVRGNDTFTSPYSTNEYERKRKTQQKRFALQNYTTGTFGLEIMKVRGDDPITKRKELTKNERLDLTALMTLPEPTMRFSRINLHTANMLEKSNLNLHFLNYWQLLKDTTRVSKTVISDLSKPYEHHADTFLKTVRNFTVKAEGERESESDNDKYNKFLNTIIPKTKFLFNLIKPSLMGNLSINAILQYLEPFMIYQEDLNASQYKEMTDYIREKILEYRKHYASKSREYAAIKGTQNVLIPSLLKILDENTNLRTRLLDVYGFSDTIMRMSNADFIKRIYEIDDGVFYNNAIALISTNLMIADGTRDMADINIFLNTQKETGQAMKTKSKKQTTALPAQALEGEGPQQAPVEGACNKFKIIAKRYIEIDELNEDSGKEAFFDKKYDPTHYDIGEKFKADAVLPVKDQIQHYIDKLMKNKGLDEMQARRDAEALVEGRRRVEDGEYAILETTDDTSASIQYYVRKNEHWQLDDTIDTETFADDMKMFCNLNEKCIAVKDKCEEQATGANEVKKHNLKLILSEFNSVLNVNKDMMVNKIEDALGRADARIETLRKLRLLHLYKYETQKTELANSLMETQKVAASPYDGLLNTITLLRQTDIAKYYLKISEFAKTFTRPGLPENNESHYWLYCIKSNKKMLPTFLVSLANTFLTGGNFGQMLDKICALQGTISDDGDKYVDKYSGYTIKMIEMSTDEEYNEEGFKIITRAVLENDVGDEILKTAAAAGNAGPDKMKRRYSTPDATTIYNVLETLRTNMGLNIEDQKDFIVRNVIKQLSNTSVIPNKAVYDKQFAMLAAKGKQIDTYEVAYNAILMYLTFGYFLIAVQTSIPPIKPNTTFPGCKKSFSGFPIEGSETNNMKGVNYVACVAYKLRNKANLPWSAIASRNDTFIAKQIESNITKFILPTEEIQNSLKELKQYQTENPELTFIPAEHAIENWANFLPPLKPLKMSTVQDLGDVFKMRFSDSLRKGQKVQEDYMGELQSKMMTFSFNIIDLIEKTVHGELAILNGKNGEPYVENACCNKGEANTIRYFVKKQPEIAVLNNKVVRLSDMYDDAKKLSKAMLLYDPSNTKRKLREIDTKFSENTIYRAFIVYCRFNSLVPVSDNLKAICPTKPEHFDLNDSLEESMRKLKSSAHNYTEHSLQQLLEIVNTSTKTTIKQEERKEVSNVQKLSEIMDKMDDENKRSSVFRADFMNVLSTFEINALMEDSPELRKLKNLLPKLNDAMLIQITEFIANNYAGGGAGAGGRGRASANFKSCLENIVQFKEIGNNLILNKKEETGYKMINFMKKTMRAFTREYPNIIINAVNYDNAQAPKHWELSGKHQMDMHKIIKGYYEDFAVFYKDPQISLLLEKMIEMTSDINALAQNTLCYAPVQLKSKQASATASASGAAPAEAPPASSFKYSAFDLDLTALLFKFYFFNVLTDLISLQTDKDILRIPLNQLAAAAEEEEDEESFLGKANELDILAGNKAELGEKIASLIVVFVKFICQDKKDIDQNYKSLMDLILRSKEQEKEEITDYLGKMTPEERKIENNLKANKLGRWSKGEQKGLHAYDKDTYDQEREEMEKMAIKEVQLNKRSVVTDMNRNIYALERLAEEAVDNAQDQEDNIITYMGEDAEPEDYDMDGDENF